MAAEDSLFAGRNIPSTRVESLLYLARVSGLLILGGAPIFGAAGAALVKMFGNTMVTVALLSLAALSWSILALMVTSRVLARRDIDTSVREFYLIRPNLFDVYQGGSVSIEPP